MADRRSWRLMGSVSLAVLLVVGVIVGRGIRVRNVQRSADALEAQARVADAKSLLSTAEDENLLTLAYEEFDQVRTMIVSAEQALRTGQYAIALDEGAAALEGASKATALAYQRRPSVSAATVIEVRNDVVYRRAADVAWTDARKGMNLYDDDRLATKKHAEAVVRFSQGSEMRLDEQSVLVIEHITEAKTSPSTDVSLRVDKGAVQSTVSRSDGHDVRMSINLPKARVVVDSGSGTGETRLKARVLDDASNRIAVYSGDVQVHTADGKSVVVQTDHLAEVGGDGALRAVRKLPGSVELAVPRPGSRLFISERRPEVGFRWQRGPDCESYRLQVGRDEAFKDLVTDETVTRDRLSVNDLKPGQHFWHVSCLDGRQTEGRFGPPLAFEVLRDAEPPRLSVLQPGENTVVEGSVLDVRCRTEERAAVFINGEEAAVGGDGLFSRQVALQLGVNTLVFEAIDEAGNVVYNSRLVTRSR